jgi:hypothetical protein
MLTAELKALAAAGFFDYTRHRLIEKARLALCEAG